MIPLRRSPHRPAQTGCPPIPVDHGWPVAGRHRPEEVEVTYHDTDLSMVAIWWTLVVVSAVIWFLAWRRRWGSAPGVRFPTGHRMNGLKRGETRFVHVPLLVRLLAIGPAFRPGIPTH